MSAQPVDVDSGLSSQEQPSDLLVLRLYVTGNTHRSTRAVENARRLLESVAAGRFKLEVIDIYLHPEAAIAAQIIAAPTLVKLNPGPLRRVIGDLSDSDKVIAALGLNALERFFSKP
ncbi:circadian clock KaiB family protein [Burkholderia sp. Leaf177]|uniref:circadian clock KaiB family protein n=1 Tax=Burkholderia sp. Leaf177 TaxID=1736287 RepID=UPI0009E7B65B|nr:circadian clock KaiB family protein [Burkholderia sp. Leaf177]